MNDLRLSRFMFLSYFKKDVNFFAFIFVSFIYRRRGRLPILLFENTGAGDRCRAVFLLFKVDAG